ncbi:MAG: iron-sulfur cluster insertion protein ErpA [Planctomycetota bacterium]|nr:iron-sulfur cluster insertion protein ErpA [Planctomycetota bacterium]
MSIKLTEKAAEELQKLMAKEVEKNNMSSEAGMRVMVVGGGCSGFSYRMGFDETVGEQDKVYEVDGVKVIVDEKSHLYLNGTEIDFHDGLMGQGFVFNNPKASGTCGCGSSFSV